MATQKSGNRRSSPSERYNGNINLLLHLHKLKIQMGRVSDSNDTKIGLPRILPGKFYKVFERFEGTIRPNNDGLMEGSEVDNGDDILEGIVRDWFHTGGQR